MEFKGSIPERERDTLLPRLRKAAGAQSTPLSVRIVCLQLLLSRAKLHDQVMDFL